MENLSKWKSLNRWIPLMMVVLSGLPLAAVASASGSAAEVTGEKHEFPGELIGDLYHDETLIRSLAHDLIDMQVAVRQGHMDEVLKFWDESVEATFFPAERTPPVLVREYLHEGGWRYSQALRKTSRIEMLESLRRFLSAFSSVEDVRFKLGDAVLSEDDSRVTGEVKIVIIGRDLQGWREWVRGLAEIQARRVAEESWHLTSFRIRQIKSLFADRDIFSEVAPSAGLRSGEWFMVPNPVFFDNNGSVAVADVDGDGWMDFLVTGPAQNILYRNEGGRFAALPVREVGEALSQPAYVALFLDFDNDGDADLFLSEREGRHRLLENRRVPTGRTFWVDVSRRLGTYAQFTADYSLAAADINRDSVPDIYVVAWGEGRPNRLDGATNGGSNLLFLSQGDGTYREVARELGLNDSRWGHAAQFVDIDNDDHMDLYLANDYSGGNSLFLNRGGRFVDVAGEYGVVDQGWGMGVSFGDYDNDGDLDLHVTRMSSVAGARILRRYSPGDFPDWKIMKLIGDGNKIYENVGDGHFHETRGIGPFFAGWAYGGGFIDIDNDGWEDVHAPNGFYSGKSMKDT